MQALAAGVLGVREHEGGVLPQNRVSVYGCGEARGGCAFSEPSVNVRLHLFSEHVIIIGLYLLARKGAAYCVSRDRPLWYCPGNSILQVVL